MLLQRFVNVPCRAITQLRTTNRVITINRQLSTLQRTERHSIAIYNIKKGPNRATITGLVNTRHQSTQSASVIEASTTNLENVIPITEAAAASNFTWETEAATFDLENLPAAIPDAPVIQERVSQVAEILNSNGEPTLASLGLCNYTPVGAVQMCLEWLHVSMNLPWCTAICIGTVCIRVLLFPLVIKAQRHSAQMSNHMPEIQYLQSKLTEARRAGDPHEASMYGQELVRYSKENNVNLFKSMIMPVVQAPIFISFFWGLRNMINAPVDSLKTGGMYWFTDLTMPDPYYILPLMTSLTLFVTIQIGADSLRADSMPVYMKYAMKLIPVGIFPFIMHFEGAILCYWLSTNVVSLIQTGILRTPKMRAYFNIPVPLPKTKNKSKATKKKGFKKGFKDAVDNFKVAREMKERENFDQMQFRRAGRGPLIKTYPIVEKKGAAANVSKNKRTAR